MTQTTSTTPATQRGNVLSFSAPAANERLNVDMAPGSDVQLPFDPGQATVSRSENSLVFELDNGGTVTINNFFVTENGGELPTLILPQGEKVPAAIAFADSGLDLTTAAGPAAASPNSSGSGDYADNPGVLIGGLDRLGKLGTDFWGRAFEVPDTYQRAPERPGGSFGLDGESDLGGMVGIVGALFEDGRPYQHQGDYETFVPGQLVFNFSPTGSTVVDAIRLSGFPAGTVIYFGDPNDPDTPTITIEGPNQVLSFTEQNFADGIHLVPPKNSDADFTLNVEVDIRAETSGLTDTISGKTTVVVDAVADKPELDGYGAEADSSGHHISQEADSHEYDRGVNRSENSAQDGKATGGAKLTVTVRATFDDYEDGSESHYIVIQTHEHLALDPDSLHPGYTYVGTIVIDGVEYHQFQVDNSVIADNGGTVELPVTFTTTEDAGEKSGQDETFDLDVGAYAEEEASDKEIDLDNNKAHIINEEGQGASATVDVVNRGLAVDAGWAYEGNNGGKHKSGGYNPDFNSMDEGDGVDADSTSKDGAPIHIRLTGESSGSDEFITKVELQFDEGRGALCVNGQPVTDGFQYSKDGVTYTFHIGDDGKITIDIEGKTDNLDDLNLTFKPDPGYDDSDVDMSYKVTVENEAGASAEYSGDTEIVIDAVADKPIGGNGKADYGDHEDGSARSAAVPGDTVSLKFTVRFPDTDGSEEHRFFIRVDGNKGSATHGYGDHIVDPKRIAELNKMGANMDPKGEYLELPIPHPSLFDENGNYTDPATGLVIHYENGVYTYEGLDVTVTDNGNGNYTVDNVEVTLPDESTLTDGDKSNGELDPDTGDTTMDFDTRAWAHEKGGEKGSSAGNNEHDAKNNDAFTNGKASVDINTAGADGSDFKMSGDSAFENNQPHNHIPGSDAQHTDADGNDVTPDGGAAISITWDFADSHEVVTEIVIQVPLDRFGNPVGEIQYRHADGTVVTYTADADGNIRIPVDPSDGKNGFDDGDLTFIPKGNNSGKVELKVSATVEDTDSGDSRTVDADGTIDVNVDAVANRSGPVSGEGSFGDGKTAFAPKEGESIRIKLRTSFDDNDGSEQHFLLVEQKPHWNSQFESGEYDLDGDGAKTPYYKIPVPTMPPAGADASYSGDAHHLSTQEWETLKAEGVVIAQRDGYTVTIKLQQAVDENGDPVTDDNGNPVYDPSQPWDVEADVALDPPYLPENDPSDPYTMGTGSLAEERDIDQNTENRSENNNTAMRPGDDITFNVDRAEGISVKAGFVYENNEQYEGPAYKDKDGNVVDKDYEQNGAISITPSSSADSFYGDLEVSIPSGHGDLYYENADGDMILLEPGVPPGNEYDYTTRDGVAGKLTVTEENGQLKVTFTPEDPNAHYKGIDLEIRVDGDYSDKDIDIDAKGNLINDNSGHTAEGVEGKGTTLVDAVAQAPDQVSNEVDHGTNADTRDGEGAKVTITTRFEDVGDNSEGHYFILEVKPGFSYTFTDAAGETHTIDATSDWPTVVGPDGKTYFKIPANPDENGNASLDLEIKVADGGEEVVRKNGETDDATFKYGAMTEEERLADGEKTYDNNIAFNEDNKFTIDVDLDGDGPGLRPIDAGVAYENNTPNAHLGGEEAEAKEYPELKFDLPEDADGIWLKPGDRGSIVDENGDPIPGLEPDADGWYYIPKDMADKGGIHFKVEEDYDDADVPIDWQIDGGTHDGAAGTIDVIVDAVAQQGQVDEVAMKTGIDDNGDPYSHATDDDIRLEVKLSGLVDPDHGDGPGGHTDYFVLVEAQPDWECLNSGAELIIIDGKSYFKVPVDSAQIKPDGTAEVEILLKNPGGDTSKKLDVGVMTQDRPGDNGEIDIDNNTSVNINGEADIKTSVAEAILKLSISEGYEDNLGGYASIHVSNLGEHDVVTEMRFSVNSQEGVFTYDGEPLGEGTFTHGNVTIIVTMDGDKVKVSFTPTPPATGLTEEDLADISDKFGLGPADGNHSSKDIDIDWSYDVEDTRSGDTASGGGDKTVVIDAVAHAPEVDGYTVDYGPGKEAALPGDHVAIRATVTFTSLEAEANFVLVQFTPGWEVNGVTLTGPDGIQIHYSPEELKELELFYPDGTSGGGAYYKLPLEKDGVKIEPGVDEGEQYKVDVDVDATVPTSGVSGDTSEDLGIGGAVIDSYGDGETRLSNNTASDTDSGDGIAIGIADSTHIDAGQIGDVPDEGADNVIKFDIRPEGGHNDVIISLTLTNTHPDPESTGHFYYDGQKLEYDAHGNVKLPPSWLSDEEKKNWTFDNDKLEFHPSDTFGGDLNIDIDASVKDAASGDSKDGLKGDMTISVEPVANAPTNLEAESRFSESDGGIWTLTLSASFADTDGSEAHFFIFKIPAGLELDGIYAGLEGPGIGPDGTDGWYTLPVDSHVSDPSVDLHFHADSSWDGTSGVDFNAGATETATGEMAWADPANNGHAGPADDGHFSYRTEDISGTHDFSATVENLHIHGSDGGDNITGGQGDDVIIGGNGSDILNGGDGDDIIFATAGTNLIIGGAGNDTMHGGTGADIFFWDISHFGTDAPAHDAVWNFEYGKDTLMFKDVFGEDMDFSVDSILGFLNNGMGDYSGNALNLEGDAFSLTAEFTETGVSLHISNGGAEQIIEVNFDNAGAYTLPSQADEAAEILRNLISQGLA